MPRPSVEVVIDSVAYGGAGVGRVDGKVYFVPFTLPGERVLVRPVRSQKRFCEARLLNVLEASPLRKEAPCALFSVCGGCAYQHVGYASQLKWKKDQVADLFRRIARIEDPPMEDTVASPLEWAYRNRIRVHVRDGLVGFFKRDSSELVEVDRCLLAQDEVNTALAKLRRGRPPSGERTLSIRPGVRFFEQTNDGAAAALLHVVEESVGDGAETLVDAYSGAGFFARSLSGRFKNVIGIESHGPAVEAARREGGANERYICSDVAVALGDVLSGITRDAAVVLLDPPAIGLASRVVEMLVALPVQRIVYVSCDPATQARDVAALVKGGYQLVRIVPVDMFPQTADVEVVVLLELRG